MNLNRVSFFTHNIIKPLRLKEVTLMSGFFVIGLVFASRVGDVSAIILIKTYIIIFFYILSVYTLNSYSDYLSDSNNPRLQSVSKISRTAYFNMTVIFLSMAIVTGCYLNIYTGGLVAFSFCLWLLYYLPPFQLKSTVLWGTIIHFIAGITHFHIGYCAVSTFSLTSILVSVYFSLLLCMGHINHELIDYDADKMNGIKNTTVTWGKRTSAIILNMLLILSTFYWLLLYLIKVINSIEFGCFFIPSIILVGYMLVAKVYSNNAFHFQKYYRLIFITGGVLFIITRITQSVM